jgi:citronellol/citronellal dehydrogenase
MPAWPFEKGLFDGHVCVVTGGGTGIGKSVAEQFLALGGRVALLGRREEIVRATALELDPSGARARAWRCDIRDTEQVSATVTTIVADLGAIDVLVNNAGGQFPSAAEAISTKGFEAVVRNNLVGTFTMTREVAVQSMIPRRRGAIVNVIANIERGFPGMSHTGAARAGVENLTRTLAVEWAGHGIRVNAVAPGLIASSGTAQYPPELMDQMRRATPFKRLGTVAETTSPIVYLASPAASFISGATLYVDGAARLWGETWPLPDPEPSA